MTRIIKKYSNPFLKLKGQSTITAAQTVVNLQNAIALHKQEKLDQAGAVYRQILELEPNNADALHLLGVIALQNGNHQLAVDLIRKAIHSNPNSASYFSNLGIALKELKLFEESVDSFDLAIALKPNYAEAYYNKGNAFQELKQYDKAVVSYEIAISIKIDYDEAYSNKGISLQNLKQFEAAVACFDKVISLKPNDAAAYSDRGIALHNLNQFSVAISSFDEAISLNPEYAEAYLNRGISQQSLKQLHAAIASYEKAISCNPFFSEAYFNLGNAYQDQGDYEISIANYDKAIELNYEYIEALYNRGISLQQLKRFDEAITSYNKAIRLQPTHAEAYLNKSNSHREIGQYEAAIESLKESLNINPNMAEALFNKASLLKENKQFNESIFNCDKLLELLPNYEYVFGIRQDAKMHLCDWKDFEQNVSKITQAIRKKENISSPFPILAFKDSLEVQQQAANLWISLKYPQNSKLGNLSKYLNHSHIRIGYYSADFYNHATSYLIAELFELHDKDKFELFVFSYGPNIKDEMRIRITSSVDHFFDVSSMTDISVAQMSRQLEIDIAIDLKGLTQNNRMGIFAHKAAPVQVSYLGYPGTLGSDYMDYLIADKTLIPPQSQRHYLEKIVYLPNSYQVNDRKRSIAPINFTKNELGLPEHGVIFCCFNNNFKITPSTFDSWIKILKQVPESVLWLLEDNSSAATNLRNESKIRGLDPNRLIFAKRMNLPEHLARQKVADLFLDTLPYNAHTTASDALWAGLPVLTCAGESFASRVAASLLKAVRLTELVTETQAEYEAMALELATNPLKLKEIKNKLEKNRLTFSLFDTPSFTKNIEAAYIKMYQKSQSDLPPDHIYISP